MVFLDDDGGASGQADRDAAAERRADALDAQQTTHLALEIDALASLLVLRCIQFGQSRAGFLTAMAHHFDAKLLTFEKMEARAGQIVAARTAARAARESAAKQAGELMTATAVPPPPDGPPCNVVGCRITIPHDHGAEGPDKEAAGG